MQQPYPDKAKWPETRRALVLWAQEHLDRELEKLPRREWFDRAIAVQIVHEHDNERDALTKANDAMFERIRNAKGLDRGLRIVRDARDELDTIAADRLRQDTER